MKKIKALSFSILISSIVFSCAKQRPVKDIPDPDQKRYKKQDFLSEKGQQTFWYHQATVIGGTQGRIDPKISHPLKVGFFKFHENSVQFLDAQTDIKPGQPFRYDYFIGGKDRQGEACVKTEIRNPVNEVCYNTKNRIVVSWPITHSEYRLAETDGKVSNIEEENRYIEWYKKAFFKIKWNSPVTNNLNKHYYMQKKGCNLVSSSVRKVSVEKNYMDFDVEYKHSCNQKEDQNLIVKYSFKKWEKSSTFKPYYYKKDSYDPLNKKYGYFQNKFTYFNAQNHQTQKVIQAIRLDPEKEHDFYLSPNFPEKYQRIVERIFEVTNDLFKKNNLKIRINLNTEKQVAVGDLRYHVIGVTTDIGGPGGVAYGVANSDPFTGEVISGNIRLWLEESDMEYYFYKLAPFLVQQKEKYKSGEFYQRISGVTGKLFKDWDSSSEKLKDSEYYQNSLPFYTISRFNFFTEPSPYLQSSKNKGFKDYLTQEKQINKMIADIGPIAGIKNDLKNNNEFLEMISKSLKEHEHFDKKHNQGHNHEHEHFSCEISSEEAVSLLGLSKLVQQNKEEAFDSERLKEDYLYFLIQHELGHILGLRHNFMGSVDRKNFSDPSSDYGSSSIMDYLGFYYANDKSDFDWGEYDKAALSYLYSNGKIDLSKEKNKTYLYCTDEHLALSFFCNTFDYGTTPTQIIKSMIEAYNLNYDRLNKPWGRQLFTQNIFYYTRNIFRSFMDMKQILQLYFQEEAMDLASHPKISDKYSQNTDQLHKEASYFKEDIAEAVKLSLAFFNAVIYHSNEDRPIGTQIDPFSGQTKKVGTFFDRSFALSFLFSDFNFFNFDQETPRSNYLSYLELIENPILGETVDNVFNRTLMITNQDLTSFNPFFFVRSQINYALSAQGVYAKQYNLIDNIKIQCFTKKGLKSALGISSESLKERINFISWNYVDHQNKEGIIDSYKDFKGTLAVFKFRNRFYLSDHTSKYTFRFFELLRHDSFNPSLTRFYETVIPLFFKLYENVQFSGDENCYDGSQ